MPPYIPNKKYKIIIIVLSLAVVTLSAIAQGPPPPPPPPGGGVNPIIISDIIAGTNPYSEIKKIADYFQTQVNDKAVESRVRLYALIGKDAFDAGAGNYEQYFNNIKKDYEGFRALLEKAKNEDGIDVISLANAYANILHIGAKEDDIFTLKTSIYALLRGMEKIGYDEKFFTSLNTVINIYTEAKKAESQGKTIDLKQVSNFITVVWDTLKRGIDAITGWNEISAAGGKFAAIRKRVKEVKPDLKMYFQRPPYVEGLFKAGNELLQMEDALDKLHKLKFFADEQWSKNIRNVIASVIKSQTNIDISLLKEKGPLLQDIERTFQDLSSNIKQVILSFEKTTNILLNYVKVGKLNVGYKIKNEAGGEYNYIFDAGVASGSHCKWTIAQNGAKKESQQCSFDVSVNKSGEVKFVVLALDGPEKGEGSFTPGQEQNASPPSGAGPGSGGLPPVNECTPDQKSNCDAQSKICQPKGGGQYECVGYLIGGDCLSITGIATCEAQGGKCQEDSRTGEKVCVVPNKIADDCSVYYNSDKICTAGLEACCSGLGQKCSNGRCVGLGGGGLPPVLTDPCKSIENAAKCDQNTEKCIDDGKGNALCVPKDYEPGKSNKKRVCEPMPTPKEGEITIPNPLCDSTLLELIRRIGNFLQWLAIILAPAMFIVAGIIYLTSGGNPDKVKTASQMMLWSAIGFVIILLSFGFVKVLMDLIGYRQ